MIDIVDRLKYLAGSNGSCIHDDADACGEAADLITRLRSELASARAAAFEEAAQYHDAEAEKLAKILHAKDHNRSIADRFRSEVIQHQRHAAAIRARAQEGR